MRDEKIDKPPKIMLYSLLVAALFLLLDALVGGWLDNEPFLQNLLSVQDAQEWWMRGITITIILLFGFYNQKAWLHQNRLLHEISAAKKDLELLINSASEGILYLDRNEKIKLANPSVCQLTGYSLVQLQQGDLHSMFKPQHPDGNALNHEQCPLCHLEPKESELTHIPHLMISTAQDQRLSIECWIRAIYNRDGQFDGWLITMIDIGLRIATEQQNRQFLEQLQTEQQRLKERNDELQRFAYVASHDLQEPLRMVSSFIQLLHRRYSDQLDDSAKEFIGFAVDGTNRMQQMINDLLNYSRIGSQSKPLEPLALQPLIDNAIANLKLTIDENDTTITMDPCDTIIMADPSQMVRLFQNLIGNAIKFQPENQRAQITIAINDKPSCITITISDNGIGIPSAYRAMVFDVFKRLHGREKYSGSGIGLSVCNRIVTHHDGTLTIADQAEGQPGTTFVITLPQADLTITAEKEHNP